jgi:hypothetical protein
LRRPSWETGELAWGRLLAALLVAAVVPIDESQVKSELSVGARDDQANPCSVARKHDGPLLDVEDHRAAD